MNEPRPRILVVEDDADQRFLYEQFLAREGFLVDSALSASEAMALLGVTPPDAVILDLSNSGLSLLEHIRNTESTRDLPVLVVSGTRMTDVLDDHPRWDHYLEKPTNLSYLAGLLRETTKARG